MLLWKKQYIILVITVLRGTACPAEEKEDDMPYIADEKRYEKMKYLRCGKSGLLLPRISLGLWNNFGGHDRFENMRDMLHTAFDNGITHIDIANNYGPPPGSAEQNFGRIFAEDFRPYRDEMIISSKAGYQMWDGPYGNWGSKKYIIASLDQSLKRTGLEYFDIFYSHRPDPETPIEETMDALATAVRSGKALYAGISNYNAEQAKIAIDTLAGMGIHCLIHQPQYNMFNRTPEAGLLDVLKAEGVGSIAFCPLAQGLLTSKYFGGIPEESRAAKPTGTLRETAVTEEKVQKALALNEIAAARGQTLAQMALCWVLRGERVTTALIGASRPSQIIENVKALDNLEFTAEELRKIDEILA